MPGCSGKPRRLARYCFGTKPTRMLYGRDAGNRTWENRQVNILLQELERFDGLGIMATNRKVALDRALERRIAIKVEFEAPQVDLRRRIWEKHVPPKMPLASRPGLRPPGPSRSDRRRDQKRGPERRPNRASARSARTCNDGGLRASGRNGTGKADGTAKASARSASHAARTGMLDQPALTAPVKEAARNRARKTKACSLDPRRPCSHGGG